MEQCVERGFESSAMIDINTPFKPGSVYQIKGEDANGDEVELWCDSTPYTAAKLQGICVYVLNTIVCVCFFPCEL